MSDLVGDLIDILRVNGERWRAAHDLLHLARAERAVIAPKPTE